MLVTFAWRLTKSSGFTNSIIPSRTRSDFKPELDADRKVKIETGSRIPVWRLFLSETRSSDGTGSRLKLYGGHLDKSL